MKKILKHGQNNLIAKCKCGCVFEFGYPDIEYGEYKTREYIYYSQVKCPECGRPIFEYYDKSDKVLEVFGVGSENEIKQCRNCAYHRNADFGVICTNCNSKAYNSLVINEGLCEKWKKE